jgi:hypothetical protein
MGETALTIKMLTIEQAKSCFDIFTVSKQGILCKIASREGNLHILQYLRSIGCNWHSDASREAAKHGYFHIIQ